MSALFADAPFVAILRGVTPTEAVDIAGALHQAGFQWVEVPLNSPEPLKSIAAMRAAFDGKMRIGAGTVLTTEDVAAAYEAGADFIVSPNTDPDVIGVSKAHGLTSMPGILSTSEAFAAIKAGADALKLFPADAVGPAYVKALKSVLPPAMPVLAVGGVDPSRVTGYLDAGVDGFGLGSALYKPGASALETGARADAFMEAWRAWTIAHAKS